MGRFTQVGEEMRRHAAQSKLWVFTEARELTQRLGGKLPAKGHVLFETGYGPSGLPHIGTFGEVARTTMVRHAFELLTGLPTRLIVFSDDMDGFRSVPTNLPRRDMLAEHLGQPLTRVPDPFGTHPSFAEHNNSRLRAFLDTFGFEYEFKSSTEAYRSGEFDQALLEVLRSYDKVTEIILPTLGEQRRATYSPFLPLCPRTGRVLQVPIVERDVEAGTVSYDDEGKRVTVPVTGGHCKLQWKADWAMRWLALDVDYEMAGKDLSESVKLASRIERALGGRPPLGFSYELFLDEHGEKISKSKGNGLSIEEWLRYAPAPSLSYFMFQKPRTAKKLYFDVIPKSVDEYLSQLEVYPGQGPAQQVDNAVWHIHDGNPPPGESLLSFSVLLNLAGVAHAEDKETLWGYIERYRPGLTPALAPSLDELAGHAVQYYQDFVKPQQQYRAPTAAERAALADLRERLGTLAANAESEEIQTVVYQVGKDHEFKPLREWFRTLYNVLLGQEQGPRMGSFVALYGLEATRELIERALGDSEGA